MVDGSIKTMEDRDEQMRLWDMQGVSRIEIARRLNITRERVRQVLGNLPPRKQRGDHRIYVSDDAWKKVQDIAKDDFDLVLYSGPNKGKGAVNLMLEMIAMGKITIAWNKDAFQ